MLADLSTHNNSFDVASVPFGAALCILIYLMRKKLEKESPAYRPFFTLVLSMTISAASNICATFSSIYGKGLSDFSHRLIHSVNILIGIFAIWTFFRFVAAYLGYDSRRKPIFYLNVVVYCLAIALLVQNFFTGNVLYYDAQGNYYHGPLFMYANLDVPLYYLMLAIGFFFMNIRKYGKVPLRAVLFAMSAVLIVFIIQQLFFPNFAVTFFSAMAGLAVLFFSLYIFPCKERARKRGAG